MNLCLVNPTGSEAVSGGTGPLRVETRFRENHIESDEKQYEYVRLHVDARDGNWGNAWERIFKNAVLQSGLTSGYLIERSGDNNKVVDLTIEDPDPDDDHRAIYLDWSLASLQVTFEYAES